MRFVRIRDQSFDPGSFAVTSPLLGGLAIILLATDFVGDWGSSPEASLTISCCDAFFIDQDNHPNTDRAVVAYQGSAVDPARTAFAVTVIVGARQPSDLSRYATAFGKRLRKVTAYARRSADPGHER